MGHSMGGHGALQIYLQNHFIYKSASAFSPACNPSKTPWGIKAFSNYLETKSDHSDSSQPPSEWLEYDSSHLLSTTHAKPGSLHVLVDTGSADDFLAKGQLEPRSLAEAAHKSKREMGEIEIRTQEGFDHSYYFVSAVCGVRCHVLRKGVY